uniref:Uncharacterized protein n=1 Tax=viral metagenome TaxID=1070528 RepID=A0A6C0D8K5_9ZZZZ
MSLVRSCNGCSYVSFPLRMTVPATELQDKYDKLKDCFSFLISSISFRERFNNPSFEDEARLSGRIDEDLNSIEMNVKDIIYKLESIQLTYPTHSDWIPNKTSTAIQNKLDIIITLYNINEQDPKYILYVIPLILDNSVTSDNLYLQGLASINQTNLYSIESIFKGVSEKDYVTYQTCVGQGDNIFICFNYTGIKISRNLYNSLLALWTNQDLTTIQKRIQDDIKKTKKKVQETLNNIRLNSTSEQALSVVNNLAGQLQDPSVINSSIDIWPTYVAPFMNQNTLPSTLIKNIECDTFKDNCPSSNIEGFTNMEGFASGPPRTTDPPAPPTPTSVPVGNIKCVALDIDGAITSDNKINFDIDGNVMLGDIQSNRDALRNAAEVSKVNFEQLRLIGGWGLATLIVLLLIFLLVQFVFGNLFQMDITPITQMGFYITIGGIFGFSGFLIGAALVK